MGAGGQLTTWSDGLRLGTRQLATTPEAIAIRAPAPRTQRGDHEQSILRVARAADALSLTPAKRLFELRESIAFGRVPVIHPMHNDALNPRVEDATREWIDVAEAAAAAVIGELRGRVR